MGTPTENLQPQAVAVTEAGRERRTVFVHNYAEAAAWAEGVLAEPGVLRCGVMLTRGETNA